MNDNSKDIHKIYKKKITSKYKLRVLQNTIYKPFLLCCRWPALIDYGPVKTDKTYNSDLWEINSDWKKINYVDSKFMMTKQE